MPYRLVIIGSGSKGNSLFLAGKQTRILIDMGFPQYRVSETLGAHGFKPTDVDALFITHTHGDHVNNTALNFCWRHKITLVAAPENLAVLRAAFGHAMLRLEKAALVRPMPPKGLNLGSLEIRPFLVPHDSSGLCFGYHLTLGHDSPGCSAAPARLGVATDLGHVPPEVCKILSTCDLLVLESNHDAHMLETSGRPQQLISRISGQYGHLSNIQAADLVTRIINDHGPRRLQHIVLSHLSEECNTAALALENMRQTLAPLAADAPTISVADQHTPLLVRDGYPKNALF